MNTILKYTIGLKSQVIECDVHVMITDAGTFDLK